MTLILAGNYAQANHWRAQEGLRWRDVRFIDHPNDARGFSDVDAVIIGSFWARPDARDIYAFVTANPTITVSYA